MKVQMAARFLVVWSVCVAAVIGLAAVAPVAGSDAGDGASARRALLVGINEYDPSYGPGPLPSCVNDALGVRSTVMLADPDRRWSDNGIQVLTNSSATAGAIRAALQSLASGSRAGDLVLYAHSSHGGQYSGTSVYLCAYDQDYSAVQLGQDLALFDGGVTVIVLVDACHSGGLFKQADGWPFAEMAMRSCIETKAKQYISKGLAAPKDLGNNIAFMTSCDYSQTCWAGDPYSLYIGTVITGCLDRAVDANRDGLYQFSELHAYAARLASEQNPNQTAQQFHEAVLTSTVARSVGALDIVSSPLAGDFDGDRIADPAVYQAATGTWLLKLSTSGYQTLPLAGFLGETGYTALAADFDGDAKADPVVYQAATGTWLLKLSSSGYEVMPLDGFLGGTGFAALAGDFDGDAKADPAVADLFSGDWKIRLSGSNYALVELSGFLR